MMRLFYNICRTTAQLILLLSLAIPVVPVLASMTSMTADELADHESCLNDVADLPVRVGIKKTVAVSSTNQNHRDCEKSCCPDEECTSQNPCLNLTFSSKLPLLTGQIDDFALPAGISSGYMALNTPTIGSFYPPAIRPPIY